jgi:hypothetical protein
MLGAAADVLGSINIGMPAPTWMIALTAMSAGK